jgi:hypothetical protein
VGAAGTAQRVGTVGPQGLKPSPEPAADASLKGRSSTVGVGAVETGRAIGTACSDVEERRLSAASAALARRL